MIAHMDQPAARERQAGPFGVAERPIVPLKPGNAGGGKEPVEETQEAAKNGGIGDEPSNPLSVQKLQAALHDKAKESPSFHFYALYDKVYRAGCSGTRLRMLGLYSTRAVGIA